MKTVGLCGGSGSGKGTVAALFCGLGVPSIDTDSIYHSLTSRDGPCTRELAARFGSSVVVNGVLDRAALRRIVFEGDNIKEKHLELNRITHRYVLDEVRRLLKEYEKNGATTVLVDAPMLFESGFDAECDAVICVVSDANLRIARIMLRDGISYDIAKRRIESQKPDHLLRELSDYCIENNGNIDSLEKEVVRIFAEINEK